MRVQRLDRSTYIEGSEIEIARMIAAGIVEGVGPKSGRIDILRMICGEAEGMERMKAIALPKAPQESAGSITSMASREVYRETLGESGHWCWNFKANRNLSAVAA